MKSNVINLFPTPGVMTGTSTIASQAIALDQIWGFAVQAVWTGTPVGTIKLQASCDAPLNPTSSPVDVPTNWTDITDSSQAVSGAGNFVWNVTATSYRWVRLVYINSSGSGVLNANLCAKGA